MTTVPLDRSGRGMALLPLAADVCRTLPLRRLQVIRKERVGWCRSWVVRASKGEFFGDKSEKTPAYDKSKKLPLALVHTLGQVTRLTEVEGKSRGVTFTGVQMICGVCFTGYVLASPSGHQLAGLLLIMLCVSTSLSGYARCLLHSHLTLRRSGNAVEICLEAHKLAKSAYSFDVRSKSWNGLKFVVSPFYEPSAIYMALNCWGLYAVGQATLCNTIGGPALLSLCAASFLLGRLIQLMLSDSSSLATGTGADDVTSPKERLIEMFLLPTGTWGFGPILNSLIWFCLFSCPSLQYPATPTGVTAPVWTAVGIPVLLLCEDIYSIADDKRRTEKVTNGSAPGLQVASVVVALCGALLFG